MMKIWMLLGASALALGAVLVRPRAVQPDDEETADGAVTPAGNTPTQTVAATIRHVKHDMNPVTLRGWTRLTCECEDGVERVMSFDGDPGVYLAQGEKGLLEHREGVFVSFTKDSGEIITPMYRMLPQDAADEPEGN